MQSFHTKPSCSRRRFLIHTTGGFAASGLWHMWGNLAYGEESKDVKPMIRNQRCQQVLDRLKGPMASIIIPYNKDFSIDHGALRAWVDFMCEKKQPILFLTHGDSELGFLSEEEIEAVIRSVACQARGRSLVIGGTGIWWTGRTVDFINRVEDSGVDAINVHVGRLPDGEEEIYGNFREIGERTNLPLLIADRNYSTELMKRIAQLPHVIGDKCHEELYKYHEFCRATKAYNFAIVSAGLMRHFLFGYFAGSTAYLCTVAPFAPQITLDFYHALTQGEYERARDIVFDFEDPLVAITAELGYPHCYKSLLYLVGLHKTTLMRPPRRSNQIAELGKLKEFLQQRKVI